MPGELRSYAREVESLVKQIKAQFDPTSGLRFTQPSSSEVLATRITGDFRRDGVLLHVKEYFTYIPEREVIDKEYRYTFRYEGVEVLRLETQAGHPEHAHFPPRYLSGIGRHFDIDRWGPDLQDMDFVKAFDLWAKMVRGRGQLPEPFRSAP